MHAEAHAYVAARLAELPPPCHVVELGSRFLNGAVRPLFGNAYYLGVDCRPGAGVDVVADAATYTPPAPPDLVVCCEVLEHAENAPAIIANVARILAPGGTFIATMAAPDRAAHSGVGGGRLLPGEFYRNVPPELLGTWIAEAGFHHTAHWEHHPDRGDLYVTAWTAPDIAPEAAERPAAAREHPRPFRNTRYTVCAVCGRLLRVEDGPVCAACAARETS